MENKEKKKFVMISQPPFAILKFENSKFPFVLQKAFSFRGKSCYNKVVFNEEEITALARLLKRVKIFRREYTKAGVRGDKEQ